MTVELLWAGVFVSASAALYFALKSSRVHRTTISALQAGIATIRDTRIAIENRPFRVEQRPRFVTDLGIEGEILFEKYGVQVAHIVLPPSKCFPVHLHRKTGEIYCIAAGSCRLTVYNNEDRELTLLDRKLDVEALLVRDRVGFVDPGAWHEIEAGKFGCEIIHFSVPPHQFIREDS